MDILHAALGVGGDDHEPIVLANLGAGGRELADGGEEHSLAAAQADEVGLLVLRIGLVLHPFIPAVSGDQRAVRPYLPEELPLATVSARALLGGDIFPFFA